MAGRATGEQAVQTEREAEEEFGFHRVVLVVVLPAKIK